MAFGSEILSDYFVLFTLPLANNEFADPMGITIFFKIQSDLNFWICITMKFTLLLNASCQVHTPQLHSQMFKQS